MAIPKGLDLAKLSSAERQLYAAYGALHSLKLNTPELHIYTHDLLKMVLHNLDMLAEKLAIQRQTSRLLELTNRITTLSEQLAAAKAQLVEEERNGLDPVGAGSGSAGGNGVGQAAPATPAFPDPAYSALGWQYYREDPGGG